VVGWVARQRGENVAVELVDVDAVALEAAKENVPGARVHLLDGLPPVEMGPFDAIVSNPPFHRGKSEHPEMVLSMIRESSTLLKAEGTLVFVVQKRLPVEETLRCFFHRTSILASDSTFRVWKGEKPRREG
jgi:16S rRNA (guanine1207-N2)-methyltransferase